MSNEASSRRQNKAEKRPQKHSRSSVTESVQASSESCSV